MLIEFGEVALTRNICASEDVGVEKVDYQRGDVGALADCLGGQGIVAVQFALMDGFTAGLAYLSESDIRPLEPDDIQHARPLHWGGNDLAPEPYGECRFAAPEKSAHIVLTRPVPELALLPGDLGVVVDGGPAARQYRVKMAVGPERNGPVITLPAEAIRLPQWYELPTVRKLHPPGPAG